jgi:hypothetical protein
MYDISVEIDRIRTEVNADIAHAISLADPVRGLAELESVRLKYLGKNGIITLLLKEHGKRMRG